ncbi:retrovirus-related pol polyprotein from transposon TNT 1-94 [Tanacetum coccineum]
MLLWNKLRTVLTSKQSNLSGLETTNEEIDEQELEAHYSYMAKIQEVPNADSGTDAEPLEQVHYDTDHNVFANDLQHFEQSESIRNTWQWKGLIVNVYSESPRLLILFIVDSGCTKHMTGNVSLLCNFVEKYLGTVRFGNDQFAPILGYGDLVQGNITIKRVYYVEGLNHNLFSVGQFCDADLEVAFRKSTCFVRDLQGNDLLTDFLISTSDFINFALKDVKVIVIWFYKLKYVKDQLCSSCEVSKAKRSSFKSKTVPSSKGRLNLLHMDLCGPMRVASINGKKYILRPAEFLNKTLNAFFKEEGIEHQTSTPRTPEQNGVVERRNRTLVEAARTMLSASKLPLFFWAEADRNRYAILKNRFNHPIPTLMKWHITSLMTENP